MAGDETSLELDALAAGDYTVTITAVNGVGASDRSPAATFTVTSVDPSPEPTETPVPGETPDPGETPGPGETPAPGGDDEGPGVAPVPEDDLNDDNRGPVSVPEAAYPGQTIRVTLGEDWAEESVVMWLADDAVASVTLDPNGAKRITIPSGTELGSYQLVVHDNEGNLIGWDDLEITEETRVGPDGEILPETGTSATPLVIMIGAAVLAGVALLVLRKRAVGRHVP